MRVCHCHGVTDRQIRACVRAGADSADAVAQCCGAGASCGGCKPLVELLVDREKDRFSASNRPGLAGLRASLAVAG